MDKPSSRRYASFHISLSESPPSSGAEWHVLTVLAYHMNWRELCAWPSQRSIADRTGLDKATVSRAIASLVEKDLVRRGTRRGRLAYFLPVNPKNQVLGGPDRWRYIDLEVDHMARAGCYMDNQQLTKLQVGVDQTATPSEPRARVPNNKENNEVNNTGAPPEGREKKSRHLPETLEKWEEEEQERANGI